MSNLFISEKFYSIQGEGKTTGHPAIFLRLSGCNLLCQSKNWICDTIEVWQKGVKTKFKDVFTSQEVELLQNGVRLIITGGEPMLHQKNIIAYLKWFISEYRFKPIIEVETNGTIEPEQEIKKMITQWNVSPKLENSGESKEKRLRPEALKIYNRLNSVFKFVVSQESDVIEIFDNYDYLHQDKVMLMPAGDTQELLNEVRLTVIELCKKYILKFTDRSHIVAWNKKTGV